MKKNYLFLFLSITLFGLGCSQTDITKQPYIDMKVPTPAASAGAGEAVSQRQWFATGKEVPELSGFDNLFQTFMKANGVRAGEFVIMKNGKLKYARAYTWAEPGYRIIQPSDPFRLASCSKMFLEQAVQSLYDTGKLTPDTKVYPLLGFSRPMDPQSDQITIQELLDHTAGYDLKASGFDPVFNMRKIANSLTLQQAVNKQNMAVYMYESTTLDHPPGTQTAYSNYGYLLASLIVEKVSGLSFIDYLNQKVLQPAGLSPVHISPTSKDTQPQGEPPYEDDGVGLSALIPNNLVQMAPFPYGGDQLIYEVADAPSGITCTAFEAAQFIHLFKVWGNGPRSQYKLAPSQYFCREGSMPGTFSWAESRGDGVDWVCIFNTRNFLDKNNPQYQPSTSVEDSDQNLQHQVDRMLDKMDW
jgi:CubicO group peptidase (beta-lactamase class C family)